MVAFNKTTLSRERKKRTKSIARASIYGSSKHVRSFFLHGWPDSQLPCYFVGFACTSQDSTWLNCIRGGKWPENTIKMNRTGCGFPGPWQRKLEFKIAFRDGKGQLLTRSRRRWKSLPAPKGTAGTAGTAQYCCLLRHTGFRCSVRAAAARSPLSQNT